MTAPNSPDGSLLGKIAGYVDILSRDPRSTAFVPLAETYRQMGLLDEALAVATKGVKAQSTFSPGFTVLGRIETQLGNQEAAASAFERALLLDPENLVALRGLARIRMQQGDRPFALKLLQRALKLKPEDETTKKMVASLNEEAAPISPEPRSQSAPPATGPIAAATASDLPPSAPASVPSSAQSVVALPQPSVDRQANPISTATIADIYIRQGFFNRAFKVYRDLLQADPHNDEVRRKLVELKQRMEAGGGGQTPGTSSAPLEGRVVDKSMAPEPSPADNPPAGEGATERQVAALTGWLDSISRRRGDVH